LDNETGNIYINDGLRKIKIFDKEGHHLDRDIILEGNLIYFYLDLDRNIWGKFSRPAYHSFTKVSHKGTVEKELAKFSFSITRKNLGGGMFVAISHGYEHDLFIAKIDEDTFTFGYSKEYKLDVIDKEGNILFNIRKDEPDQRFTAEEKDRIRKEVEMEAISRGRSLPPESR
jgi:hypothetical protein